MRKASVRDLHIRTSEFVREAAEGATIVIERRGEPVAELSPLTSSSPVADDVKALIFETMRDLWEQMPQLSDSTELVEQDRDR